jgi:hypothetical protein
MQRREILLAACSLLAIAHDHARAAPRADIKKRRLQNRLDLWENYARRTKNLVARYTSTRNSSLLQEPLVATGMLVFASPATLIFRDDGSTGSTTRIEGSAMSVRPNQSTLPPGPEIDGSRMPAAEWLGTHLVKLFAPGTGADLIANCRTHVPRGRGYTLEILPQRGSAVRRVLRALSMRLDPVGGAVIEIGIQEAQGDRFRIQLADHRQNIPDQELGPLLASATGD